MKYRQKICKFCSLLRPSPKDGRLEIFGNLYVLMKLIGALCPPPPFRHVARV